MPGAVPSPSEVRSLAERLMAIPTHSGDRGGEAWIARTLLEALPAGIERGEWRSADGRPIVWARACGRATPAERDAHSRRKAVLMLGHFDTVGVSEYAALGAGEGERVAFDAANVARRLAAAAHVRAADAGLDAALEEERAHPGRWLFGRGGLDMKAGLAAGIAALYAVATEPGDFAGDVLFVATPDEERESLGMLAAVEELAAFQERDSLDLAGAINLDFTEGPVAYHGVVGKALVALFVRGVPTHAGTPFDGVDATQLAAAIASELVAADALVDRWHGWTGAPPVLLRLRDLKPGYDTQTALDAVIELNLLSFARPVEENLSRVRRIVESAARAASERTQAMAGRLGVSARSWPVRVRLASELPPLANDRGAAGADAREATLARIRAAVDALPAEGPVIVIALVPPFYPALAPGRGAFAESTARVLAEEGVEVRPFYPMVSDASYLAWPGPDPGTLAALMPSLGRELRLPIAAMRSLSLDVLNLGPWGAGAHTIAERANAAWTFERLPRVLGRLTRAVLEERNSR